MDRERFDVIARALAAGTSRRGAVLGVIGALAGLGGVEAATGRGKPSTGRRRRKCDPACSAGQTCVRGACACVNGGAVCGATCCLIGQTCESGACVSPPVPCIAFGEACKDTGRRCCDGMACASGQGGTGDIACYVPAGGACQTTAECVYDSTCKAGVCVANPQPTPTPPAPRCTPNFPATADAGANGIALQQAVVQAASGDTIFLDPGDYRLDATQSGGSSYAGLLIDGKTIAIETCQPDSAVNLLCPSTATYNLCVGATASNSPASLSLKGVSVQTQRRYGVEARWGASITLEQTTVEVTQANGGPVSTGVSSQLTLKAGVTLRNTAANPTGSALDAYASDQITCETPPAFDGYSSSSLKCRNYPTKTYPGCGCA